MLFLLPVFLPWSIFFFSSVSLLLASFLVPSFVSSSVYPKSSYTGDRPMRALHTSILPAKLSRYSRTIPRCSQARGGIPPACSGLTQEIPSSFPTRHRLRAAVLIRRRPSRPAEEPHLISATCAAAGTKQRSLYISHGNSTKLRARHSTTPQSESERPH